MKIALTKMMLMYNPGLREMNLLSIFLLNLIITIGFSIY
jgi:hypothetical protein